MSTLLGSLLRSTFQIYNVNLEHYRYLELVLLLWDSIVNWWLDRESELLLYPILKHRRQRAFCVLSVRTRIPVWLIMYTWRLDWNFPRSIASRQIWYRVSRDDSSDCPSSSISLSMNRGWKTRTLTSGMTVSHKSGCIWRTDCNPGRHL